MLLLLALQAAVASGAAYARDQDDDPSASRSNHPGGSYVQDSALGRSVPPDTDSGIVHRDGTYRRTAVKLESWASPNWRAPTTTVAAGPLSNENVTSQPKPATNRLSATAAGESVYKSEMPKRAALRPESWASPNWSSNRNAVIQTGASGSVASSGSTYASNAIRRPVQASVNEIAAGGTDLRFDPGANLGRYALRPRRFRSGQPLQQTATAAGAPASVAGAGPTDRRNGLTAERSGDINAVSNQRSDPVAYVGVANRSGSASENLDKPKRPLSGAELVFEEQQKFAKYVLRVDKNAIVRRRYYEVDPGSNRAEKGGSSDWARKSGPVQRLPPVTASLRNSDPRALSLHYQKDDDFAKYAFHISREVGGRRGKGTRDLEVPALTTGSSIGSKGIDDRGAQAPAVAVTRPPIAAAAVPAAVASTTAESAAKSGPESKAPASVASIKERLEQQGIQYDVSTRLQSFLAHTRLSAEQAFNYENNFARLPTTEINTELRPVITAAYGPLDIMAKPRARFQWDRRDFGPDASLSTTSEKADVFLLEGRARLALWDKLFLSYGREALLWGPAMYITPSNPFFVTNNRSNPYREIRGRDYAKATYIFNNQWTASFFSNLGLGLDVLLDQPRFQRTDAFKLDFTGIATNASLILSRRDDGQKRIGGYVQWTTSDALLLYVDGNVSFGTDALYARQGSLGEWDFQGRAGRDTEGLALFGASYTASFGPTLSVEYVHNTAGYGDKDASMYYTAVSSLRDEALNGGVFRAAPLLSRAQAPGLSLLRKNYLFLQLLETNLADQLDVTIRYTHNLDDGSSELVPILDWSVGTATHIFALAQINMGSANKEARRYVDNQVFTGINFTFD